MPAVDTYLLLRAFCDELARCGLRHACTSPGSRSTPIVLSLVRQPRIRTWSHIDERCAGFFALGAAKASATPVALACTSGTAAANFAPAVIEAWHARVPLIVLTADRPPELREVGAGQAIDQLKLYGDSVKWFFEVGVDRATDDALRWIRQLACRAYWTTGTGRPGPVHLNFPLREPLVLEGGLPADPVPGRPQGRPWVTATPVPGAPAPAPGVPGPVSGAPASPAASGPHAAASPRELPARGVVVAGGGQRNGALGSAAARFAEHAGYPLLADPLSGARHGKTAVARYDVLLRDPRFADRVRPELVIRVGDLPTSKPLRTWLASLTDTKQLALDPDLTWQDPAAAVTEIQLGDPAAGLGTWDRPERPDPSWLASWTGPDQAASEAIERTLGPELSELSEPLVAARLGDWLPPEATLFVASSMPIRDVELYFPAGAPLPRVLSNRGTNGIDGTVSAAFGVAAASEGPVVLLIGDVALAHDIGGLLAARRLGLSITIVLLNNDGGGIFHFLPVSSQTDAFEAHVATPHGLSFEPAAALYGCGHERPGNEADLHSAIDRSLQSRDATIIEVRSDRQRNLDLHRRIADAALAAL